MLIRELLETTSDFPTIRTDALLREAAQIMRGADVRAIAVVENDRLVGIVTDWDVVEAFATRSGDVTALPVSAVMTSKDLATIGLDDTVAEATNVLGERRVHHLPVVVRCIDIAERGKIRIELDDPAARHQPDLSQIEEGEDAALTSLQ